MNKSSVDESTKAKFKEHGVWDDFCSLREKYKQEGHAPKTARMRAVEEINDHINNISKPEEPKSDEESEGKPPIKYNSPALIKPIDASEDDLVKLKALSKKKASYNDSLEWAMHHIDIPVEIEDAISPLSWSLLKTMRQNPSFRTDMFTKVAMKKSSKEDEEAGKEAYDGEAQVKVLRKLKEISDKARKEAAAI